MLALLALLAGLGAATAAAQDAPVLATNGSTLQAPANLVLPGGANQCAARPYIGLSAGNIQYIPTSQTTCMWWSTEYGPSGEIVANTYVPRGAGAVTRVRVRSGAAPAPLQFAILGSGGGLCCTTQQISPVVQPAPDAVNEFAVNLPAGSGVGTDRGSQFNDILVVVAAGPGSLPVSDRGTHGFLFGSAANQAQASFLHPALTAGASNTDVGIMDGYEVLLQYDWCGVPMTLATPQPVAPADPATACAAQPPAPGPPAGPAQPTPPIAPLVPVLVPRASPLRAVSPTAAVRPNRAALRLRCLLTTACAGTVALRPRAARAAPTKAKTKTITYGTARFRIAAGRTTTLKITLTRAGRAALKRHRHLAIDAVVTSGTAHWTLKISLQR
jgi:hypothetical protein